MLRNRSQFAALPNNATPAQRRGATLIEVLMSLLIFSVGIVSVFALFPISILQSIRATQLTNSRIQRDNVDELVKARPELLLGARFWEPNTAYPNGHIIVPRPVGGNRFPNNNLYYTSDGGTSGPTEPAWGPPTVTGTATTPITWSRTFRRRLVIDPQGRFVDPFFGHKTGSMGAPGIQRLDLASPLRLGLTGGQLEQMFSLPDSWNVSFEAIPTSTTVNTITFPSGVDLGGITTNDRVIVTSANGRKSVSRNLTSSTSTTITLATDLPLDMDSVSEISTVRVEVFNRRYTWMLTVNRNTSTPPVAQCVCFFNRSYKFDDEEVYAYQVAAARTDLSVTWSGTEPFIREGNFAFDTVTCRWHRIVSVSIAGSTANIVLEVPLSGSHNEADPIDNTVAPPIAFGGLIFMPNIVHVYDL